MKSENTKLSDSDVNPKSTPSLSHSDLIGVSRSNKFAALSNLNYRVKPDNDSEGADYRVKFENDSVCTGRSMVEMLGVLAIIGVLSVGAIAGYSKAMMKYKLNKQTEQLSTVINAVARNIHSFDNIKQDTLLNNLFIKMGELPTEMIKTNDTEYFYDVFNSKYYIYLETNYKRIVLYMFPTLSRKSSQNLSICRNMLITAKENADSIMWMETLSGWNTDAVTVVSFVGDIYCNSNYTCLRNITLDNIYNICTKHIGKQGAHMKITWTYK
ncbi:MAG: hypothetical protein SO141_06615 [Alphaproteobacteria bacterium]|nr:hypothetical protein [Alphaproteobacteria bacterium]